MKTTKNIVYIPSSTDPYNYSPEKFLYHKDGNCKLLEGWNTMLLPIDHRIVILDKKPCQLCGNNPELTLRKE